MKKLLLIAFILRILLRGCEPKTLRTDMEPAAGVSIV